MENAASLPSFRLDAELVGDKHSYDAWRETIRCVYDVNPLTEGTSTTERLEGWLLDNLIFSETAFSQQTFSHHAKHTRDANYLTLQIYKSGGATGVAGDVDWQMKPGDVHIYDFSQEFRSVTKESVVAGVTIPHAALGYEPGKHPAYLMFDGASAVGRLMKNSIALMLEQLPELNPKEAPDLASMFCGMLSGLMLPQKANRDTDAARHRAARQADMRAFLDRNLSDPTLGIDDLLPVFAVSRPVIYRDFAEVGGVAAYINRRRLDRALHQLMTASSSHTRVKDIADKVGFEDPAYFSRLFRQRFGVSPAGAMKGLDGNASFKQQFDDRENDFAARQLKNWFNAI